MWNLVLAAVWAAAAGEFDLRSLAIGFVLGWLLLAVLRPFVGSGPYVAKVANLFQLVVFFVWELLLANLRVAHDVLTLAHHMNPGVIAIRLDAASDIEITVLANLISLTPGSLSLDVSSDRRVLYVHVMYLEENDPRATERRIKSGFERRILALFR